MSTTPADTVPDRPAPDRQAQGRKILIIAEKPSVARELAAVVGARAKRDGWIEGPGHIVTWCLGHLVEIAEPERQNPDWGGRWSLGQLPMLPQRFLLEPIDKSRSQFEVVKRFLASDEVGEVVNGCDAGREGELIFRRMYVLAGSTLPMRRLWASDMTEEGLKKALAGLMPGEDKRNLGLAAYARSEADWLVGLNFTRLFTTKAGELLSLGRVQTPVLALLVDRRREIEQFVPRDYWVVEALVRTARPGAGGEFTATWYAPPEFKEDRVDDPAQAEAVRDRCQGRAGTVLSAETKKGSQKPPLPYDLTTLQREANTRFGFPAKKTLDLAQGLYEARKALTYPRTDSRYLTKELLGEILGHLRAVYRHFPEVAKAAADRVTAGEKFACVDNKKVTDHHAIIPTAKPVRREDLTEDEWKIYELVARRFIAALLPAAEHLAAAIWVGCEGERFKATGRVYKARGWLDAEPSREAEDKPLPEVRKGDPVTLPEVRPGKKQTRPPAQHTDASLLGLMETAGRLVESEELAAALKERGLGTPATRAQIIETLLKRGYVDKAKKSLVATDKGCQLVDLARSLLPALTSPDLTGDWEAKLRAIEAGSLTYPAFMGEIRDYVRVSVEAIKGRPISFTRTVDPKDALGPCPLCDGTVVETAKGFGCANWKSKGCRFVIWKDSFGDAVGAAAVKELLKAGRTRKELKLATRDGREYASCLVMERGRVLAETPPGPAAPGRDGQAGQDRPAGAAGTSGPAKTAKAGAPSGRAAGKAGPVRTGDTGEPGGNA